MAKAANAKKTAPKAPAQDAPTTAAPFAPFLSLANIVSATLASGFLFTTEDAAKPFLDSGDAEMNKAVVNPDNPNEFAVRATSKGINTVNTPNAATAGNAPANTTEAPKTEAPANGAAQATEAAKPTFARKVIPMPVTTRGGGGGGQSIYPFADLVAPTTGEGGTKLVDAFFVPSTTAKPKPWESLQSAVSAATRRFATKTGDKSYTKSDGTQGLRATYNYTRKFKLSEGTDDNGNKGAWVSRVQ